MVAQRNEPMLPMSLAPRWLYLLSRLNPFSQVGDGARAAVRGDFGSGSIAVGFIAALRAGRRRRRRRHPDVSP
jgi:hypothetical protein